MPDSFFTQPQTPAAFGNFWAGVKSFGSRGGFLNGLNPFVVGKIYFVNGNTIVSAGPIGSDANNGTSPITPFATVLRALTFVKSYDFIVIDGVIREQVVTPAGVFNVTIIGGSNFTPRQATSGGVATNGGASWLPPTTPVALTPLIEVTRAGWAFFNIQFSPTTSSACVRLTRSATVDLIDASHALFSNCYFAGGTTPIGIEDNGGCGFVVISGCRFQNLTTAIKGLNTAAAIPLSWMIEDCRFQQNTNDITMSLSYAIIQRSKFMTAGAGATNKVISTTFISTQGGNNHILLNQFTNTEAEIAPGTGYTGAASDTWMNYVNNQAALAFGQPA